MVLRLWKTLRHYIALHELLCIFSVSATVFVAIFWFIYSSMVISNVEVIHRLDFYSMHCGLISERLSKEIDDLNLIKEKLSYEVALLEGKRNNDLSVYKQVQTDLLNLQNEKRLLLNEISSLTTSYRRLQNELFYSNKELAISSESNNKVLPTNSIVRKNDRSDNEALPTVFSNYKVPNVRSCCQSCPFSFYLIEPKINLKIDQSIKNALSLSKYRVIDPTKACIVISFGRSDELELSENSYYYNRVHFETSLNIVDVALLKSAKDINLIGFNIRNHRPSLDIILPYMSLNINLSDPGVYRKLSPFVPLKRYVLVSFETSLTANYSAVYNSLFSHLSQANAGSKCILHFNHKSFVSEYSRVTDIPGILNTRLELLRNSTFAIVTGPSVIALHIRLIEALSQSTVPIIFLSDLNYLPFGEFIDWRLATLVVSHDQIPYLINIAKTVSDHDLMALKRRGRDLFMQYFINLEAVVNASLEVWRFRLSVKAHPVPEYISPYRKTISHPSLSSNADYLLNSKESPQFTSNHSFLINQHSIWNTYPGPFWAYPNHPDRALLPSEAKFIGSEKGFRPINFGKGGDGKFFRLALGGDIESESFTILILTYKREQLLMQMIKDFDKLPNLHSVIVVWNAPGNVSHNLVWPIISAPIHVVKGPKNSLNNRFLPYEEIKTEAVLSLDDDVFLTHEEILLTFRVWRENRDRIVGLPGRLHSWDPETQQWTYNNYLSCELSLVLTGAAFLHKYYFYLYTYSMPVAIREKVDEYMNCEDIAVNFLVSHITRKPPIKATAKRTFFCAQCGEDSLWIDSSHLTERSECINYFSTVYGYNPLLSTQFRADSILYRSVFADPEMVSCFDKV